MQNMIIRHSDSAGLQSTYASGRFAGKDDAYIVNQIFGTSPLGNVLCSLGSDYVVEVFPDGTNRSWFAGTDLTPADGAGKAWYLTDRETGDIWSAFFNPVGEKADEYEVSFSPGQVSVYSLKNKIAATLTIATTPDYPMEIWHIKLENRSAKSRTIAFTTYIEPCVSPFLESRYFELDKTLLMRQPMEASGIEQSASPLRNMVLFHTSTLTPTHCENDKSRFIGDGRTLGNPQHLEFAQETHYSNSEYATAAGMTVNIELPIEGEAEFGFCFGVANHAEHALEIARCFSRSEAVAAAVESSRNSWNELCSGMRIETSDSAFDALVNTWLPYETYSAWIQKREHETLLDPTCVADILRRLYPFCATAPRLCRESLLSFARGLSTIDTLSRSGGSLVRLSPYELLWLAFITARYVAETGDISLLSETAAFKDGPSLSIREHCERAMKISINSRSLDYEQMLILKHTIRMWQFVFGETKEFASISAALNQHIGDAGEDSRQWALPRRVRYLQSISTSLADKHITKQIIDSLRSLGNQTWNSSTACAILSAITDHIFGLTATCEGLILNPNLPPAWNECKITRLFRGDTYEIYIKRPAASRTGKKTSMVVDGEPVMGSMLPFFRDGGRHRVDVTIN